MKQMNLHPASHCPLLVISRADGRSSVAAAAYAARTSMTDNRTGLSYSYRSVTGLLNTGLIGWRGTAEELWNAAEGAEVRGNARVARELRPALPAELPLNEQYRLVKGFSCWLRDEFGVAVHHIVHAPTFVNASEGRRLWRDCHSAEGRKELEVALFDPNMTNRNFHAHIRFTTREVDSECGTFGIKTRDLDDKVVGPKMLLKIRAEWERRTNQALTRNGSDARIDLRSYTAMAEAGDAPKGLEPQRHLGPRTTQKTRMAGEDVTERLPLASLNRGLIRARNDERWHNWMMLRALEREKARLSGLSEKIAADRESARKATAKDKKCSVLKSRPKEVAPGVCNIYPEAETPADPFHGYEAAIAWAQSTADSGYENSKDAPAKSDNSVSLNDRNIRPTNSYLYGSEMDEFDRRIDPETYDNPDTVPALRAPMRIVRKDHTRGRVRGS
ncbi:MobA/MobL family protein [Sulfitobacter sp. NFXS29]|uniref:MobA/MobL family protein n=1 Tax=Sulfitobacter sp. NFXS29 TaxID=2818438 RepID=UPI0032DF898E